MKINLLVAGREGQNAAKNIRHLLFAFANRKLPEAYIPVSFNVFTIKKSYEDQEITLDIANCLGQEQFPRILSTSFSRDAANAFLLVCDENDEQSLLDIRNKLYPLILAKNTTAPIVLVCIREDVTALFSLRYAAQALANEIKAEYAECSIHDIGEIMSILDKVVNTCIEQENNFSDIFDMDLIAQMSLTNRLLRSSSSSEISADNAPLVPPGTANFAPAMQTEEAQDHVISSASESSGEEYSPRMRR